MSKEHNRRHVAVLRDRFTLLPLPPLLETGGTAPSPALAFSRSSENQGSPDTETTAPISYTFFPGVDSFPQS